MTLISIITINLNNEVGVKKTLLSFEKIKNDNRLEFIFVDGLSNDNSIQIAREFYKSEKIIHEKDSGLYDAMNKGAKISKGKYLLWVNSGDEIKPVSFINSLNKVLFEKADMYLFGLEMYRENTITPEIIWKPIITDLPSHTFPHPSTFIKRETFKAVGMYNLKYKIASDRDLILKIFLGNFTVLTCEDIICKFYFGGVSGSKKLKYENILINKNHKIIKITTYMFLLIKLKLKDIIKRMN